MKAMPLDSSSFSGFHVGQGKNSLYRAYPSNKDLIYSLYNPPIKSVDPGPCDLCLGSFQGFFGSVKRNRAVSLKLKSLKPRFLEGGVI